MLFSVGSSLPEHRIKASIDLADSSNQIQNDEYAQRCGFRAGLVSGTTIFAYMSRPLVEFLGRDWLERGSAEVRFLRPIYEGEDIRITGTVSSLSKDGVLVLDCNASNSQGTICGIGKAHLPLSKATPPPSQKDYPPGPDMLHRPISLESLIVGDPLSSLKSEFTWNP